ncbi:hypothetical protein V1517DRAFT_336945 [Lipomyces orientalis]|uniref:Uncharacterized protein n=1 Tax=Lipomyces orientalis TaxID=1233043 RepID=A0ACC3TTN7_9ASCO
MATRIVDVSCPLSWPIARRGACVRRIVAFLVGGAILFLPSSASSSSSSSSPPPPPPPPIRNPSSWSASPRMPANNIIMRLKHAPSGTVVGWSKLSAAYYYFTAKETHSSSSQESLVRAPAQ